jgi:hypothetical protein
LTWYQQLAEASSRSPCRGAIVQVDELGDINLLRNNF